MKAKREFYMHGNDRQFADEHLISTMTGEPMPRKWQRFIELTPEEKARWDASLRLDAEYRRAEAQGFPNGIPGGKTRGNALYTLTQMEEEHERALQKKRMEEAREQYEQSFIPYKTEIRNDDGRIYGNINLADQLWQNPYDTQKNDFTTGISAFLAPQTEKEPAFDVNQAIQNLADNLRERWDADTAQPTANTSVQFNEDSSSVDTMNNNVVTDLKQILDHNSNKPLSRLELYEILSKYGITYKDIKTAYPDTAQSQFNLLDQEFDPTDTNTLNIFDQIRDQIMKKSEEKRKNNPDDSRLTDYELYEILSPYGARYMQIKKKRPTPEQEEVIRKWVEQFVQDSPIPILNYRANDSVYERSVMQGEGAFFSPNLDLIEKILKEEKRALEKDIDQAVLEFFGSVDAILALCPQDSRLAKLGARLGYLLLAVAALRCVLDVQRRREKLINDLVTQGRERREAEAETLPIYHKWLLNELTTLVLEDWVSDFLPLIFIPQQNEENPGSSII